MTLSPDVLLWVGAGLLSVILEYTPVLAPRYDALDATKKRLIMLGLLVLATIGAFGLGCAGRVAVSCDLNGALDLAAMLGIAIGINQGVHGISKRPWRTVA